MSNLLLDLAIDRSFSQSAGPEGGRLREAFREDAGLAADSASVSVRHSELMRALIEAQQEARAPGWDGPGTLPLLPGTCVLASSILYEAAKSGMPLPVIAAHPDGVLGIEWLHSKRWRVALAITPLGVAYCAALFGADRETGRERLPDEVLPRCLARMLDRYGSGLPEELVAA